MLWCCSDTQALGLLGFFLFVPNNLFCVYTLLLKHSAKLCQADRLYQSEHSPFPAPQNTRLLRDARERQCEDHSSFCSSLTCRNK